MKKMFNEWAFPVLVGVAALGACAVGATGGNDAKRNAPKSEYSDGAITLVPAAFN